MKPRIRDWKAIEADYWVGVKSLRLMASEHGVSHAAIIKQARKQRWVRDRVSKVEAVNVKQTGGKLPAVSKSAKHKSPGDPSGNSIAAKRGAPSRKTPELIERILVGIAEGKSTRAMCNKVGLGQRTLWDWLASDREFSQQYARAKQICADHLADEIIEIADDNSQDTYISRNGQGVTNHKAIARARLRVDARKWYASKLVPKKYGGRISL